MATFRILLVDDEEELVTTLVDRLEFRGIEAEAVTSGSAALARLREKRFDAVVADLKMPGMSGTEVLDRIRLEHPDVRVLLITGHGSGQEEAPEILDGTYGILLKPFSIDALIEKLGAGRDG
jgi:CheY-like chemotaxis protein